MNARALNIVAGASLIALITLCMAWELWLAPQHVGGSWLVLKVLPLLAPLIGILRGKVYTYRWMTLLIIAYFVEGAVRATPTAACRCDSHGSRLCWHCCCSSAR